MKLWKISNASKEAVKVVVSTSSSTSIGVRLQPEQFVLCAPKQTPTMDAQVRRRFITVDRNFDNQDFDFKSGQVYDNADYEAKKLVIAEAKALEYVNKKTD